MNNATQAPRTRKLSLYKEFEHEVTLAKELPYWDFRDDLVVLADGSLVLGFRLKGVANETWDAEQVNQFTLNLRSFLNALPDSFEVSLVSETNSDYSELIKKHEILKGDNPLLSWVADSRVGALNEDAANFELLRSNLYLFVYSRFKGAELSGPLSLIKRFLAPPRYFNDQAKHFHAEMETELRQVAENTRARLEANGIKARALDGQEILSLVYKNLNPNRSFDIAEPKINREFETQEFSTDELGLAPHLSLPTLREQLIFSDLIEGYQSFLLDGWYHRTITLKTLPEFTYSALVSRLTGLGFPHQLHMHIRVPEQSKELASLQAKRRVAHSMSASQGGKASDLESEAKLQSTEELLKELINTGQKIFYFQFTILLREKSEDDLERRTKTVLSLFRELNGAEALAETVANYKVWKTLFPFGTTQTVRNKRCKTDNLADFLPVYQPEEGPDPQVSPPVCLFRNRSSSLVSYNPFNPSFPNFNSLVTGSSGAGKSFLNNLVLLQYATQKPLIYIIDIGGSYKKLCEFLGGQYIDIQPPLAGEIPKSINPFELAHGETEPSPQKIKFLIALLENILTDKEGDRLAKLDKSLLEETILKLYPRILKEQSRIPTLNDLALTMEKSSESQLKNFSKMLYPWTGNRPYGRLLDAGNQLELASDFVVFDLKGLSNYPDLQSAMILIITDYILTKVESKDEKYLGRKRQILLDECWELLKSPASSNFMEYCVRTLRKTGSGITFITQGLEEIVASPIGSAILSNTATKFILLQRGDLDPIRKVLKLNDQEMALIASLRQEKGKYSEAFLMANEMRTVIRACPTPLEYWLATSDAADNALLNEHRKAHPDEKLPDLIHRLSCEYPKGASGGRVCKE
jgi:type IV secretory pathway VirB4 component